MVAGEKKNICLAQSVAKCDRNPISFKFATKLLVFNPQIRAWSALSHEFQ